MFSATEVVAAGHKKNEGRNPGEHPGPGQRRASAWYFLLVARIAVDGCGRRARGWETRRAEAC